jgi:hypothetical protein
MQDYILNGYAEEVRGAECSDENLCWYLPHHPVYHQQKPNKVRVVFDCACSYHDQSLNEQLLTGPDFMNSLFGVLLRFRRYRFVFAADIEAMFHQVKTPLSDRRYLQFLWWKNGDMEKQPVTYRMTVHPFGAKSSPFCASFALRQTLKD